MTQNQRAFGPKWTSSRNLDALKMAIAEQQLATTRMDDDAKAGQSATGAPYRPGDGTSRSPRVALLTPYTGGNLGDAAIQDAMIINMRLRRPDVQFSGITLNCGNFVERHGIDAFPLCAVDKQFYGMSSRSADGSKNSKESDAPSSRQESPAITFLKKPLKRATTLWGRLKSIQASIQKVRKEFRHCVKGYRFLRTQDLVIVSGGGQLDEEWGGPWGHPFALFKWAVLAGIARIPFVIASVGACKVTSASSRFFLRATLRVSRYRSYRDTNSRKFAAGLLSSASRDPVVPDPAFSLPSSELPRPARIRSISEGRTIIAVSPIAYAKPGAWPFQDRGIYDRYLQQMARTVSMLLDRDYFLIFVWSARADESAIHEILGLLDPELKKRLSRQTLIPPIATWKELVAVLMDVDFLIASRLHSAILGFVAQKPTVAISFDPKVDWIMQDLGQTDYLLQIRNFTAESLIDVFDRLKLHKRAAVDQIASYQQNSLSNFAMQYDALSEFAKVGHRRAD